MKFNEWLKEKPEITEECLCIIKVERDKDCNYYFYEIKKLNDSFTAYFNLITYINWKYIVADEYFLIKI